MKLKSHPIILGFYGESNSGKTTLIEKLVSDLTAQGYAVAAVKITNKEIHLDIPGKDTARFARAGAEATVLSSSSETAYVLNAHLNELAILDQLKCMGKFDIIFVEGARDDQIPKIRLGGIKDRFNTVLTYGGNYPMLLEKIQDHIISGEN